MRLNFICEHAGSQVLVESVYNEVAPYIQQTQGLLWWSWVTLTHCLCFTKAFIELKPQTWKWTNTRVHAVYRTLYSHLLYPFCNSCVVKEREHVTLVFVDLYRPKYNDAQRKRRSGRWWRCVKKWRDWFHMWLTAWYFQVSPLKCYLLMATWNLMFVLECLFFA